MLEEKNRLEEEGIRHAKKKQADDWHQEEKARILAFDRARKDEARKQKEREKAERHALAEWEDLCKASIESVKSEQARLRRVEALAMMQHQILSHRAFLQAEAREEAARRTEDKWWRVTRPRM